MNKKVVLFPIIILAFIIASLWYSSCPNDKSLEDNFHRNRAEFEQLITMIKEDNQVIMVSKNGEVLDISYRKSKDVITTERLSEYLELLNKTNALSIRVHTDNKKDNSNFSSIDLLVYESRGWLLGIGGTYKFYIFTQTEPERLVNSLDDIYSQGGDASHAKKISENWYLYLDIW